jgi:hypothetical protein
MAFVMRGKRYSSELKAKLAFAAPREERMTTGFATKHEIQPTMITGWK